MRLPLKPSYSNGKERIKAEGLNGQRYVDMVMKGPMTRALAELGELHGVQAAVLEDLAPAHRSKVAKLAREEAGIIRQGHPAASPDLNPIEPIWFELKRRVAKMRPKATTLDKLWAQIEQAWADLPRWMIDSQIDDMEVRRVRVLRRNGWHTGY